MNVFTTRRSILIGSLTTAAFPLEGFAHEGLKSQGSLLQPFDQADFLIPAEQLSRTKVEIEAYDENGHGRTGRGHLYCFSGSEQKNHTAIVTDPSLLVDARRNFEAKRVFVTFTPATSGQGKKIRLEVANYSAGSMKKANAHSDKLAVVASVDWHQSGNEWHLKVA